MSVHETNLTTSQYLNLTTDALNITTGNDTDLGGTGGGGGGGGGGYFIPWNNPENVMTKETSDEIVFVLECFVFPIVTVFGSVGNILSLLIISNKKLRNSTTSIVLIGLASSDLLFLVTNMIRKSTLIIKQFDEILAADFNARTFRYIFYLKTCFSRVSTLLVVVISLERFIAVAFPLQVKSFVTKRRMYATVALCYIITFGGIAGIPPQYTYTEFMGKMQITQTDFAKNNVEALKIYNSQFLPIVYRYIPVLLVIIFNTAIISIVGRQSRIQKAAENRKDEQRRVTRMLICVALFYLLCLIPGDLLLIYSDANPKFQFFGTYHNLFMALSDISLLFEMTNSSINFIIYMVLNRNFYDTYKALICSCRCTAVRSLFKETSSSRSTQSTKDTSTSQSKRSVENVEKAFDEFGVSDSAIGSSENVNE